MNKQGSTTSLPCSPLTRTRRESLEGNLRLHLYTYRIRRGRRQLGPLRPPYPGPTKRAPGARVSEPRRGPGWRPLITPSANGPSRNKDADSAAHASRGPPSGRNQRRSPRAAGVSARAGIARLLRVPSLRVVAAFELLLVCTLGFEATYLPTQFHFSPSPPSCSTDRATSRTFAKVEKKSNVETIISPVRSDSFLSQRRRVIAVVCTSSTGST